MGIIECFSKSLYDFKAYGKMKNNSPGKIVLYLFLIACLFGGLSGVKTSSDLSKLKNEVISEIEAANPRIENGVLSLQGDNNIKEFGVKGYKLIIDPSDSKTVENLTETEVAIVFGSKDVTVKNYSRETVTKTYSELNRGTVDKSHIIDGIIYLFKVFIPLIFIAHILSNFLGGFILALFMACILLAVSSIMKAQLRFGEVYKISVYILTPIYLINTVLIFIGMSLSFYFQVLIGLIFGFVIIKSIIQDRLV